MRGTVKQRFFARVALPNEEGCMLWTGARARNGYGSFWYGRRVGTPHRFAYEMWIGPIPVGLNLDHLCRVRHCVAPDHLEPVTNGENVRRGLELRTHCRQGHPLSGDNLKPGPAARGHRECRACDRERHARRYREGRAR